jgi:hypothetical protein
MNTNILFKQIENKNKQHKCQIKEAPLVSLIMLFLFYFFIIFHILLSLMFTYTQVKSENTNYILSARAI